MPLSFITLVCFTDASCSAISFFSTCHDSTVLIWHHTITCLSAWTSLAALLVLWIDIAYVMGIFSFLFRCWAIFNLFWIIWAGKWHREHYWITGKNTCELWSLFLLCTIISLLLTLFPTLFSSLLWYHWSWMDSTSNPSASFPVIGHY